MPFLDLIQEGDTFANELVTDLVKRRRRKAQEAFDEEGEFECLHLGDGPFEEDCYPEVRIPSFDNLIAPEHRVRSERGHQVADDLFYPKPFKESVDSMREEAKKAAIQAENERVAALAAEATRAAERKHKALEAARQKGL